ncbi:MAG: methyltransferase domain-containing protein [Sulfuricella sp.]|nr:methyltransferase domain-containing protein [Sulfuricella sp.]
MEIMNPAVIATIESGGELKINMGSGKTSKPGFFNLDLVALPNVDIVADINQPLSALPDNSVDAISSCHVFEHITNLPGLMEELYRVCRPGARIEISVPHFSNPHYFSDPTHVRPWGLYTMSYFMDEEDQFGRGVPSYYSKARFLMEKIEFAFYRTSLLDRIVVPFVRALVNSSFSAMEIYERRWCWIFPAWEIRMVIKPKK